MNDFLGMQAEKARILFEKNKGQEKLVLDELGKKCAKLLHNIIVELVNKNFDEVRRMIDRSFVIKDNMLEKYNDDITSVISFVAKKEMSYRDFIGMACESIFHENHILFYATIYLVAHKLNTAQRMFFDDIFCLKGTLKILDKKANLNYPFSYEKDVVDMYTELLLGAPVETTLFYQECMNEYYPIGGILKTKDDYAYKQNSKYNTDNLSLSWVKNDYEDCIDRGEMREFIIEVDDYINTIGNKNKSTEMWNYLTEALLSDYLESPFPWNVELSKSLIMSFIGYSKCYEEDSKEYVPTMRKYILAKLTMLKKVILLLSLKKKNGIDEDLLQISLFLINLYYAFPLDEIREFIYNDIIPIAVGSSSQPRTTNKQILSAHLAIVEYTQTMIMNTITNPAEYYRYTKFQSERDKGGTREGCYIATAVYGDYNDPNVMVLRRFRDNYLSERNWGRKFIELYYRYSPRMADKLKNHIVINAIIRKILDLVVKKLRKNQ